MISELELIAVEAVIISTERPDYLEVSSQNGWLHILAAKWGYEHYSLEERYDMIYNILKVDYPFIIKSYPVLIETLDTKQLGDLFKVYGKSQ